MNHKEILEKLSLEFGQARLVLELHETGLRNPVLRQHVEVRGLRDSTWRRVGMLRWTNNTPWLIHNDDREGIRAALLFQPGG
jgi:hypothetical protein